MKLVNSTVVRQLAVDSVSFLAVIALTVGGFWGLFLVDASLFTMVVFGLLMIWVATAKGFFLHLDKSGAHGSEGVSKVTTDTVVLSSIAMLYADYIVSSIIL